MASLTSVLGLLVLGIPMASVRFIAGHVARRELDKANDVIATCLGISLALGAVAALVGAGLSVVFEHVYLQSEAWQPLGEATLRDARLAYWIVVAQCYYLDQRQTWAAVVERELGRPEALHALGASRAHVGNVARAIVTCEHLDQMLQKILPRYRRLDAVIIMVGASDLVSWLERGLPRAIPEDGVNLSRIFEQHPEVVWRWSPRATALWRILANLNRRLRRPVARQPRSGGWLHRVRRMRAEAVHRIDEVPDAGPMLDHFSTHLAALIETARAPPRPAGRRLLRLPALHPGRGRARRPCRGQGHRRVPLDYLILAPPEAPRRASSTTRRPIRAGELAFAPSALGQGGAPSGCGSFSRNSSRGPSIPSRGRRSDLKIRVLATKLSTYPDLSVVCGHLERDPDSSTAVTNPTVLVEVLSDSTEAHDRGERFAQYRRIPSLREYVLVAQTKPLIEVRRKNEAGLSVLVAEAGAGEQASLESVGCVLRVDEVYADPLA